MKSRKEIRCKSDGRLLFVIVDNEYIEINCSKCGLKQIYQLPDKVLTSIMPSDRIVLKNIKIKE